MMGSAIKTKKPMKFGRMKRYPFMYFLILLFFSISISSLCRLSGDNHPRMLLHPGRRDNQMGKQSDCRLLPHTESAE